MSSTVAGGPVIPGTVPITYCNFSPSALMTWLNPSSSMAMEVRIRLMASSLDIGLSVGKVGCDIVIKNLLFINAQYNIDCLSIKKLGNISYIAIYPIICEAVYICSCLR
jgi:hypothetical protein